MYARDEVERFEWQLDVHLVDQLALRCTAHTDLIFHFQFRLVRRNKRM